MARPLAHFLRLLALCVPLVLATACTTNVYVRVPAVCPRDPECLAVDQPNVSVETARAREAEYVRRAVASTVTVRGLRYNGTAGKSVTAGTGTIIGAKGYIVTAYHLIQGADVVTVTQRVPSKDGRYYETRESLATPLVSSRSGDMTLLYLTSSEPLPASMPVRYDNKVIVGDRVWFLGSQGPLASGMVMQTDLTTSDNAHFADAEIVSKPSDNGAPVLNVCGEIVGVALGPYGTKSRLRLLPIEDVMVALGMTRADLR